MMECKTYLAFWGDKLNLNKIVKLIDYDELIFNELHSIDMHYDTKNLYVYKIDLLSESDWIDIEHIENTLEQKKIDIDDVVVITTDCSQFVDVVSMTGEYDTTIDDDDDKVYSICETYGIDYIDPDDEEYVIEDIMIYDEDYDENY